LSPQFTAVIPAYNAEPFLAQALDSVLEQSLSPFEVVVCDDASSDGTWSVMQRYADNPQVRLLRREQRGGAGAARNDILKVARGNVLVLLDADDLLLADTLELFARFLSDNPQVDVIYGDQWIQEVDAKGLPLGPAQADLQGSHRPDLLVCPLGNSGVAVRTDLMRQCGGYDESLLVAEDWDFWLRAVELGGRFHHLAGHFACLRRRHPGSTTRSAPLQELESCNQRVIEKGLFRRYETLVPQALWRGENSRNSTPANKVDIPMNSTQCYRPASEEIVGKVVDDEAIVLDLANGNYYSLEESGALIWQHLVEGLSCAEIERVVLKTYQADPQQVHNDLQELLQDLLAHGLIKEA